MMRQEVTLDAHDYARLASLVAGERAAVASALERFRAHHIGNHWRGRTRAQAEVAREGALEEAVRSLGALDDAEREALRLWRAALAASHPLEV